MAALTAGACPRCTGRLVAARDGYGAYRSCLNCGFVDEQCTGPELILPDAEQSGVRRRDPSYRLMRL